jgi:AraC-like DNA-binding protein
METDYRKYCYDSNPYFKIHHSHGIKGENGTLGYLHYDNEIIITYYRKGESSLRVEGNIYNINEGDVVILKPDELHLTIRSSDCYLDKIVYHINESVFEQFGVNPKVFLSNILQKSKGKNNLIPANIAQQYGIIDNLTLCFDYAKENTSESQVLLTCKMVEVISQISKLVCDNNDTTADLSTSNKKVNEIISYINRHSTEDITLDFLANKFYFSKYYISHLFKDYVGVSPYDYLIIRRLYNCNNLIRAKYTVKEACFMVGFNNYSNFYRLYKKHFKITPQEFKEQLKIDEQKIGQS